MSSDGAETKSEAPKFTEKEEAVLKAAWLCLKGGPPEIDIEKLTVAAGFNTQKTAANTWGVIKRKMFQGVDSPAKKPAAGETKSAKKGTAKAVKRELNSEDENNDAQGGATPAKKARKATPKKPKVAEEDEA